MSDDARRDGVRHVRPVLRPGLRSLRVEGRLHLADSQCDVALPEAAARLVAAVDGVRDADAVLAAAGTGDPSPDSADSADAWCWLLQRRLVVDADEHLQRIATLGSVPPDPPSGQSARTAALTDLLARVDGDRRWLARRACRVSIRGDGAAAAALRRLLAGSGVRTTDRADDHGELVVLCHDHEPPAELLAALVRADTAHLIGGLRDTTARIGPFVVPGWSACGRCYDLRRGAADPSWRWRRPLLARPAGHPLGSSTAPAHLVQAAAALLTAEVLAYVEGREPHTCGATLELEADDLVPVRQRLEPHPWCGCVWPTNQLDGSATMES